MKIALRLGETTIDTVDGTADDYTQERPWSAVVVYATVAIHLSFTGDATTNDFLLAAENYFVAKLEGDEVLSYIAASTSGTIRITRAD